MKRIADEENALLAFLSHPVRHRSDRCLRRPAFRSHYEHCGRHVSRQEIPLAHCCLTRGITRTNAPGEHNLRSEVLVVEGEGVVQAGLQDRRGAPVVLGRPEDDDSVSQAAIVLPTGSGHIGEREYVHERRGEQAEAYENTDTPESGHTRKLPGRRRVHQAGCAWCQRSKDCPSLGMLTFSTPSSRRSSAIACVASFSPWTMKARRIGPPRRRTHSRSSFLSACAE